MSTPVAAGPHPAGGPLRPLTSRRAARIDVTPVPTGAARGQVELAPADRAKFRLNIGVRTLDQQVKLAITVTDKDGNVVKNVSKTYDPNYFLQDDSGLFLDGYALAGGDAISFEVTSGSAFIYGGTTDNTTNDPSVQFAQRSQ